MPVITTTTTSTAPTTTTTITTTTTAKGSPSAAPAVPGALRAVHVDILPDTFNVEGTQTVAIAIRSGEGVDVTQIDLRSIRLSGAVAPQSASHDGGTSLVTGFSAADVIHAIHVRLGRAPHDGESVTLELTGALLDGTPIRGSDVLKVQL
jgi:hypothetical protein